MKQMARVKVWPIFVFPGVVRPRVLPFSESLVFCCSIKLTSISLWVCHSCIAAPESSRCNQHLKIPRLVMEYYGMISIETEIFSWLQWKLPFWQPSYRQWWKSQRNDNASVSVMHRINCMVILVINPYRQTFNIRGTKSQNLNVSHLVLQLYLPSQLKPDVKWRMKIYAVGTATTGDATTSFKWSVILLATKLRLILEVWRHGDLDSFVYLTE